MSLDKLVGGIIATTSGSLILVLILVLIRLDGRKISARVGLVGFHLGRSRTSSDLSIEVLRAVEDDLGTIKTKDVESRSAQVGATNGDAAEI